MKQQVNELFDDWKCEIEVLRGTHLDDHMTTELCMKEIENCQRISVGPNFVAFLGQKYGYRPIPTIISGREYALLRNTLHEMGLTEAELLDLWYREDTNSVPSVFILQPISSILSNFNNKHEPEKQAKDQRIWWETLDRLQKLLRIAAQDAFRKKKISSDVKHNYFMSVTEREIINGILRVENTKNHCLAYIRNIHKMDLTNFGLVGKFIDLVNNGDIDSEAQQLLSKLRDERIINKMQHPNLVKFKVEWYEKDGLNSKLHSDYLQQFSSHFYHYITKLVRRAMRKEDQSDFGRIITEILQHSHTCNNAVKVFLGREEEINQIFQYIHSDSRWPLVVHGYSGGGKTSLLAKAASLISEMQFLNEKKPLLILKFIGATPESSTVIPLLTSICQQIAYNLLLPLEQIPDDLIALAFYFKQLLVQTEQQKLFIFVDSLDQLSGPDETSIKLSWLTQELPSNVKIIVSCATDGDCKDFDFLKRIIDSAEQYIEVKPLEKDLAVDVIKFWLNLSKRDLTRSQWEIVDRAISVCTLPIYIKLVFAEVVRWKSYSKSDETILRDNVGDSIMRLFNRIELQHGQILVAHALAYITASKCGLSEGELEDLISLDDVVLNDVYQYHLPPVRRIPPLLWTRIRNDLPGYLTERFADGVSALNWYHKQFRLASLQRYFKQEESLLFFHSSLADYFLGIWGGGNAKPFQFSKIQKERFKLSENSGAADRKVPAQPLAYFAVDGRTVRYNLRKLGELPFHLTRAKRYDELLRIVLFDYEWLHTKLCCCPLQATLSDFQDAIQCIENDASFDSSKSILKEISLLADTLRLAGAILIPFPNMLAPQILARLLPLRDQFEHINKLLTQCDKKGASHCALLPISHSLHTPGGPLMYSLEGHHFAVFDLALTSDFRYVISVSNRFIMWDLATGEVSRDVDPQVRGIMLSLVVTRDDKFAITFTNYNEIFILNVLIGEVVCLSEEKLRFKENIIGVALALTSNDKAIAWSSKEWIVFDVKYGNILGRSLFNEWGALLQLDENNNEKEIITIDFKDCEELHVVFTLNEEYYLETYSKGKHFRALRIHGGFVLNYKKSILFVGDEKGQVYLFRRKKNKWGSPKLISQNEPQKGDELLSLMFARDNENVLVAICLRGFNIWKYDNERKSRRETYLHLPAGVRNIITKPLKCHISIVFTKNNQYAIAAARKSLYVWSMQNADLLKVLDAHYGRIIQLRALIVDELNAVITSSFDKTIKVWNVKNLFEQVHPIDRMELPIESITFSSVRNIAITVTRNCIGLWCLKSAKLWTTLADSPIGAVVTHGVITHHGKYMVSCESGNFLIWDIEEEGSVVFRRQQTNVKQLYLADSDTKAILIVGVNDSESVNNMRVICLTIPDGEMKFTIDYFTLNFTLGKCPITTIDSQFMVIEHMKLDDSERFYKSDLAIYMLQDGYFLHSMQLETQMKFIEMKALPYRGKECVVALIGKEYSFLIDIYTQRILAKISRWSVGHTSDGKYGLYAPTRGGLELVELKHGSTVKVLLPRTNDGVHSALAGFTSNDEYVYYYHPGRKTIRLIRLEDGKLIANYRVSADVKVIKSTVDGAFLVIGGVDGSFTVLVIVDTLKETSHKRLNDLPSRVSKGLTGRNPFASWKIAAKLATLAAKNKADFDLEREKACEKTKACVIS